MVSESFSSSSVGCQDQRYASIYQQRYKLPRLGQSSSMEVPHREPFDVVSALKRIPDISSLVRFYHGTRIPVTFDSLRDKYVVVCCVSLPYVYSGSEIIHYEEMIRAYPKLVKLTENRFEIIVVCDTPNLYEYNVFFRGFPGVTVPFEDMIARSFICWFIRSRVDETRLEIMAGVILDPRCNVLQDKGFAYWFSSYGASCFPFTHERVTVLGRMGTSLTSRFGFGFFYKDMYDQLITFPVSLMDLLNCEPDMKLESLGGGCDEISVVELNKVDCVEVYICVNGNFIRDLASVYRQCRAKNLVFEVVIVCIGFPDTPSWKDLEGFKHWSSQFQDTSSWWLFPCSYESKMRLKLCCPAENDDCLFIVRPDGKFWDKMGKSILLSDGINAYPFTMESIFERMTSLTLDSLLCGCPSLRDHLLHKNVLVYFDNPEKMNKELQSLYCNFHFCNPGIDVELVFIPVNGHDRQPFTDLPSGTAHFLSGEDALIAVYNVFTKSEIKAFQNNGKDLATMVAFGKDGRIRSSRAHIYLKAPDKIDSLFGGDDTLLKMETDYVRERLEDHKENIYRSIENVETSVDDILLGKTHKKSSLFGGDVTLVKMETDHKRRRVQDHKENYYGSIEHVDSVGDDTLLKMRTDYVRERVQDHKDKIYSYVDWGDDHI